MKPTLSPKYTYTVTEDENGQLITLLQVDSGKTKEFKSVARSVTGLDMHLATMTEVTCKEIFGKG
jgi:hypothetical protein